MELKTIYDVKKTRLNIIKNNLVEDLEQNNNKYISDHMCYILKSTTTKRFYIGYTIDFKRRLRQHNGEIVGGAKKTETGRPWVPICQIKGFFDKSSALRFEWKVQHSKKPRPNNISNILTILKNVIEKGDGLLYWPQFTIEWGKNYENYNIDNVRNHKI